MIKLSTLICFFFQTNMISMDALHKVIDASQLTVDLEGTLHYDHSVWIELRCVSYSCHSYREKDKAIDKKEREEA